MELIIKRGEIKELNQLPPFSIALDGFVQGPEADASNHRFSFDHHQGCLRSCTMATCWQAWSAILMGLDPNNYTIFINDVDSDVALAVWCLQHPDQCADSQVKKIVEAIAYGDMYLGGFPFPQNGMLKTVEWISAPETDSKRNGDYNKLSDTGLEAILEAIIHRVDLYVNGEASTEISKQVKHEEHKILRTENDWVLVESQNTHIYRTMYHAGFDRVVRLRKLEDESLEVGIARRSIFVERFPIDKMCEKLNKLEAGWGGSQGAHGCVLGSPRNADGSRSKLSIEIITQIIDEAVLENN